MQWTNRALDYAPELGDERVIAYTLMHVRPMDSTGRPMKGMVFVGRGGLDDAALGEWVATAAAFARALPSAWWLVRDMPVIEIAPLCGPSGTLNGGGGYPPVRPEKIFNSERGGAPPRTGAAR